MKDGHENSVFSRWIRRLRCNSNLGPGWMLLLNYLECHIHVAYCIVQGQCLYCFHHWGCWNHWLFGPYFSSLLAISFNAVIGKARHSFRRVKFIHYIVASSPLWWYVLHEEITIQDSYFHVPALDLGKYRFSPVGVRCIWWHLCLFCHHAGRIWPHQTAGGLSQILGQTAGGHQSKTRDQGWIKKKFGPFHWSITENTLVRHRISLIRYGNALIKNGNSQVGNRILHKRNGNSMIRKWILLRNSHQNGNFMGICIHCIFIYIFKNPDGQWWSKAQQELATYFQSAIGKLHMLLHTA